MGNIIRSLQKRISLFNKKSKKQKKHCLVQMHLLLLEDESQMQNISKTRTFNFHVIYLYQIYFHLIYLYH